MARNQLDHKYPQLPTKNFLKTTGFTLIEVLVVTAISMVLLMSAASLFYTTLLGNSKKTLYTTLKDEGDYAISQMEFLLRNSLSLEPVVSGGPICTPGMTQIALRSLDRNITTLLENNDKIASQSAIDTKYLTSSAVRIQNLTFDCQQTGLNRGTFVKISLTIEKDSLDRAGPSIYTENFSTSVNIRNL